MKTTISIYRAAFAAFFLLGFTMISVSADDAPPQPVGEQPGEPCVVDPSQPPVVAQEDGVGPCVTDPTQQPIIAKPGFGEKPGKSVRPEKIDVEKQPWLVESEGLPADSPVLQRPKMLWAKSYLWAEAPEIVAEKWITDKPDMKDKYILVECWATWCPPCRRSLKLLNYYHEKFKDELCVIAINCTDEEALKKMVGPTELKDVKFHLGIDTQGQYGRFADKLGVFGIPHAVIIEPQYGCVIWEGMPTLPGHELSEDVVERILEVGRKLKEAKKAQAFNGASQR